MRCKRNRKNQSKPMDKAWRYLKLRVSQVGSQLAYAALLMFYAYNRSDTPGWAKNIILGALAYFVSPIDSIPDLTPLIGFTDDFGVLSFGLVSVACYINDDVRQSARAQINLWFKNIDEEDLVAVDARL